MFNNEEGNYSPEGFSVEVDKPNVTKRYSPEGLVLEVDCGSCNDCRTITVPWKALHSMLTQKFTPQFKNSQGRVVAWTKATPQGFNFVTICPTCWMSNSRYTEQERQERSLQKFHIHNGDLARRFNIFQQYVKAGKLQQIVNQN